LPDHVITPALKSPFMTWFDWTLGAFVAERLTQQRRAFSHRAIWLCCLIPAFIGSTFYKPLTAFSFSLAATLFAVVLDIMLKIQWRKSVLLDAVVFIGTISYSIYLWHQPLLFSFAPHVWSPFGLPIVSLAVIFIISAMSWALIERNGIKLGKALLKLPSISRLFSKQNDIILPQPE
jgi:peptidoglycan/LPS O-acetylase OafA/YrhL